MKKSSNKTPEVSPEKMQTVMQDFLLNQKTFKDLKGITDNQMEAIYTTAYNFYSHGKFERAKEIFSALCQLDQYQPKYWIGLGAVRQMLKDYQPAIDAYGFATLMNPTDPKPAFYAANCFMKLNDTNSAIQALEAVLEISKDKTEFKDLRSQAENLLEGLHKKGPQKQSK